ncbi:MAG TPA: hypothetical protein ENF17_09050 [Candidatus Aminicenantes bacterium]|nr:hypothetical protein [Candidatus Aminicenantes bacterium]
MARTKRNKFILLILVVIWGTFACSSYNYVKLRMEFPIQTVLSLEEYSEIKIVHFVVKRQPKGMNLDKELRDYWQFELSKATDQKIALEDISIPEEAIIKDKDFWKSQAPQSKALFFTGLAEYKEEVRKALLRREKRQFEDPFQSSPQLAERKFFSLVLDLYLIDSETGEIVNHRQFKENHLSQNKNQTAYFAFFNLIQKVKQKFFRQLFGGERIQERYLIR